MESDINCALKISSSYTTVEKRLLLTFQLSFKILVKKDSYTHLLTCSWYELSTTKAYQKFVHHLVQSMQMILSHAKNFLVLLFHQCMNCSHVQNQLWHQIGQMVDKLMSFTRLIKGPLYMYQTFTTNDSKMKPMLCLLDFC